VSDSNTPTCFLTPKAFDNSAQGKTLERRSSVLTLKGLSIFGVVGPPLPGDE